MNKKWQETVQKIISAKTTKSQQKVFEQVRPQVWRFGKKFDGRYQKILSHILRAGPCSISYTRICSVLKPIRRSYFLLGIETFS